MSSTCCGLTCLAGLALGGVCCYMAVTLFIGFGELFLGLYSYFGSAWMQEHTVSILNGTSKNLTLYEICDDWPPNQGITKACPPIGYEESFVVMLFGSIVFPVILSLPASTKSDYAQKIRLFTILTNIASIVTASLYIASARQIGKIIGKEVIILSGPYDLRETMKVWAGSIVIVFSLLRIISISNKKSAEETLLRSSEKDSGMVLDSGSVPYQTLGSEKSETSGNIV